MQVLPRVCRTQLGNQFSQHGSIIGILETLTADKDVALGLAQGKLQFVEAIGGIQRDENCAYFGSRKLRQDPRDAIGGPNADALALSDAQYQQRSSNKVHFLEKFRVSEATVFED